MRTFSLAFLLGIVVLQNFSHLPATHWIWICLAISISALFWRFLRLPAACLLGFAWCLGFSHAEMHWTLPDSFEGKTLTAIGYIASIPATSEQMTSFQFAVQTLQFENTIFREKSLVHLNWRGSKYDNLPQKLHAGDQWQLSVRLKKVYGTMNPGGFDYEAHALQEGIRANGYVLAKNKADNQLLNQHKYSYFLTRAREYLKTKIEKNLPLTSTSPWIVALVLGERNNISAENWEILRNTGTNHLMAIAGLHVGIMSGLAFAIVSWAWRRRSFLALRLPAQHAGSIAALIMALLYSALAGFSLPTQRACIMLSVFLGVVLLRRKILSWHAWSVALMIVLLLNPLNVLTESFWLSFGAVAFIIYGVSGRLAPTGIWWKWGRIQWVIAVGLIPLSIWLFQQCSIISFVANSIAIPWVGFLVVPLSLLGAFLLLFSVKLGSLILITADKILSILWIILTWFSHVSWGSWYQVMPSYWILIASCIGVIVLLCPAGFPGRYLGFIGLLPLFFYKASVPKIGDIEFTLLDVGQGLSAVVQTHNHVLVFDAGPKLGPNFDMGESVVVPFLRARGVRKVDMLVVSHGDNDHIGGAPAILKRFIVNSVKTSVPEKLPTPQTSFCLRGEKWRWDQVDFQFLYPTKDNLGLDNNSSCVLRVTSGNHHILLAGDIEKYAENNLVDEQLASLPADILVAPHHGSKTSAVIEFLTAVHPKYILFPTGYRNRYHFPHAVVLEKYTELGSIKINTVQAGAIDFKVNAAGEILQPALYRMTHRYYWNN